MLHSVRNVWEISADLQCDQKMISYYEKAKISKKKQWVVAFIHTVTYKNFEL